MLNNLREFFAELFIYENKKYFTDIFFRNNTRMSCIIVSIFLNKIHIFSSPSLRN